MSADYRAFYRGRRIMITGGLGFIASNLARQLVGLDADVLLVDSLIPDYGGNLFNIRRLIRTARDLLFLWFALVIRREHLRPGLTPLARTAADPANRIYPSPPRP